jgi:hypothetical protein
MRPVLLSCMILCWPLLLTSCGNAGEINGQSIKTAYKSVSYIKERLPEQQRLKFELAYWSLRKQFSNDAEFLNIIDKKNSRQIIELGKNNFQERKQQGDPELAQFENWDQMIAQQLQQRDEQMPGAVDSKDKKSYPRVDYKMHAM